MCLLASRIIRSHRPLYETVQVTIFVISVFSMDQCISPVIMYTSLIIKYSFQDMQYKVICKTAHACTLYVCMCIYSYTYTLEKCELHTIICSVFHTLKSIGVLCTPD